MAWQEVYRTHWANPGLSSFGPGNLIDCLTSLAVTLFLSLFLSFSLPLLAPLSFFSSPSTILSCKPTLSIYLSLSLLLLNPLMASYRRRLTTSDLHVRLRSSSKKLGVRNCLRDARREGELKGREEDKERWQGSKEETMNGRLWEGG